MLTYYQNIYILSRKF